MGKRKFYLTLDTETATLPFANDICRTGAEKQKISISKPLVYDIGWTVTDRQGYISKKRNFLIQETFFVPEVFNTAYYKEKRQIYIDLLNSGKIQVANWNNAIQVLIEDLQQCYLAAAYNACFDFKKAIPFTEKYIEHLYSSDFQSWYDKQKKKCLSMLQQKKSEDKNPKYLVPTFEIRGFEFPILDLWGVSCERLLNTDRYKNFCLKNGKLTKSVQFFETSAESCFQYINKTDFIEEHTALSDAEIETQILLKALKKGKLERDIQSFPFRQLGTTFNFVEKNQKYVSILLDALEDYILENDGEELAANNNSYWKRIINAYYKIEGLDKN